MKLINVIKVLWKVASFLLTLQKEEQLGDETKLLFRLVEFLTTELGVRLEATQ